MPIVQRPLAAVLARARHNPTTIIPRQGLANRTSRSSDLSTSPANSRREAPATRAAAVLRPRDRRAVGADVGVEQEAGGDLHRRRQGLAPVLDPDATEGVAAADGNAGDAFTQLLYDQARVSVVEYDGQRSGLDIAAEVALAVDAVAIGAALVAELQRAEEDASPLVVGEQPPDRSLRAGQLGEGDPPARRLAGHGEIQLQPAGVRQA